MNQNLGLRVALPIHPHDLWKNINRIMSFTCLKSPVVSFVPRRIQTVYMSCSFLPEGHCSGSSLYVGLLLLSPPTWTWLTHSYYLVLNSDVTSSERDFLTTSFKEANFNPGHSWAWFVSFYWLYSSLKYKLYVAYYVPSSFFVSQCAFCFYMYFLFL